MAWHLQIGFDEGIMKKVDAEDKTRQKFIFSMLVIMMLVVSILVLISSIIYLLIIFHNWAVAIGAGLFLSLVVFNIYRFLTITALNAEKSGIGEHHLNHEKQYADFIDQLKTKEIAQMPEEAIRKVVNDRKDTLREKFSEYYPNKYKVSSSILTMAVRVAFLSIIALVFSTGLELFIFKSQVNEVLDATANSLRQEVPDSWILKNMLTPEEGKEFTLFHCNSLLLIIDVLQAGLGYWKLILDLLFLSIFLLPLILIFKSKEIQKGDYVRELALHEISISFYHYLKTQKYCVEILNQVTTEDLVERFRKSAKYA
jgi:hypothetical protein